MTKSSNPVSVTDAEDGSLDGEFSLSGELRNVHTTHMTVLNEKYKHK